MAHSLLKKIVEKIKINKYFTIIADEATDSSFKEQVSICLRHVSGETLEAEEDFIGLYEAAVLTYYQGYTLQIRY